MSKVCKVWCFDKWPHLPFFLPCIRHRSEHLTSCSWTGAFITWDNKLMPLFENALFASLIESTLWHVSLEISHRNSSIHSLHNYPSLDVLEKLHHICKHPGACKRFSACTPWRLARSSISESDVGPEEGHRCSYTSNFPIHKLKLFNKNDFTFKVSTLWPAFRWKSCQVKHMLDTQIEYPQFQISQLLWAVEFWMFFEYKDTVSWFK